MSNLKYDATFYDPGESGPHVPPPVRVADIRLPGPIIPRVGAMGRALRRGDRKRD